MKRIFSSLKPYWLYVLAILALTFVQVVYCDLQLPNLMSDIISKGVASGDKAVVWESGIRMLLLTAVSVVCAIVIAFLASLVSRKVSRDLRHQVFTKVEGFSLAEFDKVGTASLITRTTNDVLQVETFLQMIFMVALAAPFTFVGAGIMAYQKDPQLSLVIYGTIPVLIVLISVVVGFGMPLLKTLQQKIDTLNRVTREALTGIRVIRAYNRTGYEEKRFEGVSRDYADTAIKINRIMGAMMPIIFLIVNSASVVIVWVAALQITNNDPAQAAATSGNFIAVIGYSMQTLFSIMMFSIVFVLLPRAVASTTRIEEVLSITPTIVDQPNPAQITSGEHGHLQFAAVSLTYEGAEEPTLCDIDFDLRPGETTTIIGSTGSGKSTIVNLMMRFYDPTKGTILLDGVDIKTLAQHDLRGRIGYVPQKAFLFEGTIKENILYGNEDATDEEVAHAAKIAQAADFIEAKPKGYDDFVAQGGTNLSGGQKQRLAIARALVRKPEVYIFDDSFSALDLETDAKLQAALKPEIAKSGATNVVIAQRVASAMSADRVIVLDEGRVDGIGTHEELLETSKVYQEIVASQITTTEGGQDVA